MAMLLKRHYALSLTLLFLGAAVVATLILLNSSQTAQSTLRERPSASYPSEEPPAALARATDFNSAKNNAVSLLEQYGCEPSERKSMSDTSAVAKGALRKDCANEELEATTSAEASWMEDQLFLSRAELASLDFVDLAELEKTAEMGDAKAALLISSYYSREEDYTQAINWADKAISDAPDKIFPYRNLGKLLLHKGDVLYLAAVEGEKVNESKILQAQMHYSTGLSQLLVASILGDWKSRAMATDFLNEIRDYKEIDLANLALGSVESAYSELSHRFNDCTNRTCLPVSPRPTAASNNN